MNETEIVVRYHETDQMGIVHHGNYVNWFEVGRTNFIKDLGVSYRKLEESGVLLPVLEVNVVYHSPARYEDIVTVRTMLEEYNGIRLKLGYEVYRNEDQKRIVSGTTEHCWTSIEMKPVSIKRKRPELHELFLKEIN
ncbi:acyl-CoA thioesterase [Pseudalkalibacillus caeni]|uniref:Acyl-CoA thioesterase n=1 Tax=Exobacillus caeni TaxID=2574798 RepID=A0A5R9FBU4_9BACL|nr:thioesterase family protein [Pseudalkalibacillus caeni]TLS39138.1 acyl-CoA thioesterase [Pseudalkalibacillus caeni]